MRYILLKFLLSVSIVFTQNLVSVSQVLPSNPPDTLGTSQEKENVDELGRTTPRGVIKGYFQAMRRGDYETAVQYFYLEASSYANTDTIRKEQIKQFENLLDKAGKIDPINMISDLPEGDVDDTVHPNLEEVGVILWKEEEISVLLEQVATRDGQTIWLFSQQTMNQIPDDLNLSNDIFIDKVLPEESFQANWRGAPLSHWIGMCILAVGSYLVAWLLTIIINRIVRSIWHELKYQRHLHLLKTFLLPFRLVITVALFVYLSRSLDISILVRQTFSVFNISFLWIALFIFIWLLIGTLATYGEHRLRENNNLAGLSVTLFLRNSAKFILIALAFILILDTFGVNVTAGLAALGIGGIALALGAQKTIENLVGSITVIFDQPVRVGDFCKFGDTLGTVESIGMRSTRIRTLDRTVVTIPNGEFSSRLIENYTHRDMFLFRKFLGLRYETSSDQMRYILVELRKLLYAHPKVTDDPARVRFLGHGSDSLQVEIFAYVMAIDYNEFLGIQEDLNLRLTKVIEDSGSGFAFPSQTIYLSKDSGLSAIKTKETEEKVEGWIKNNELEMPEFDEETKAQLRDTIKFPPDGSRQDSKNK